MTQWLLIAVGVLLTLGTAVFVAAEFSLVTLDRSTVEADAERNPRHESRNRRVLQGLSTLSTQLSGAQVGITLTTLLVGFLVEPALAGLLDPVVSAFFELIGREEVDPHPASVILALVIATVFSMVFGELVPKNLALSVPLPTARAVIGPQRLFTAAARPLLDVLNGVANAILRVFGIEPHEELSTGRTPAELAALVRRSGLVGTLPQETARILARSLDLGERTAADVMTPRMRTLAVDREDPVSQVVDLARRSGHSRFPVVDGGLDDVTGLVHLKAALAVPLGRRAATPVHEVEVPVARVPETVRLGPLLAGLRSQGLQLAVVVDEYGGTAGVVTLEDVVEEIIGEVADEHDRPRATLVALRDGSWNAAGLLRPDELRDRTGFSLPEGRSYETLGGLVMALLGRIPQEGDELSVGDIRVSVERMDGRRVDRLRLARPTSDDGAPAEPAPDGPGPDDPAPDEPARGDSP
jgi:CBS domain containing-hemolysin-like protein